MRTAFAFALLLTATMAVAAQDAPQPLSIAIEPLGDSEHGVVTRVFFRFANPRAITEAGLYLEGSFAQEGCVPRNFRYAVPRKDDKYIGESTRRRNGRVIHRTRWALLPDQRNELSTVHTFIEGNAEISARLVLEGDFGKGPVLVAKKAETFALVKTNRPLAVEPDVEITPEPREATSSDGGAVRIDVVPAKAGQGRFVANVDAQPPVRRVEFWLGEKKMLARNKPPYLAEIELGDPPQAGVPIRAVGFDGAGAYVDADAFVFRDGDDVIVTITRVETPDGMAHFKLSVRNRNGTALQRIALQAGEKTLHEWDRPPYSVSMPRSSLAGVPTVRAVVVDENGFEASDLLQLAR